MNIAKDMKVAGIFVQYPQTHRVFQKFGFGASMNPALRETFGRLTSVEGCRLHGVDLEAFLISLNEPLRSEQGSDPA